MNRILFALCWVASAAALAGTAPMDSGSPADVLQLRNIEVTFHTAGSVLPNKDLGLMMSLYSDDAVLTDTAHGNKVYQGKDQVLTYWRDVGAPFRPDNHWIGYTPAFRMHAHAKGDTGTLYFECLWMEKNLMWPGVELNHRHADFQSAALPTELPGRRRGKWLLDPAGAQGVKRPYS
jgi:ketosteroid isomerase-like protein